MDPLRVEPLVGEHAFVIRGVLTPAACAAWIARAEQLGFEDAPIRTVDGDRRDEDVRNNTRLLLDSPADADALWRRLQPALARLSDPQPIGLNERLRIYRYHPGQYFRPHLDGHWRPPGGQAISIYSVLVYLNDDMDGGATRLLEHDLDVQPEAGMALCFTHRQLHAGAEVRRGHKYVLRTDLMFSLA